MINAVSAADKRIDAERERITKATPVMGERRANGTALVNPRLQQAAKTVADAQIVEAIRAIKAEADTTCIPALKYLERAALTSKAPEERIFSKTACLSRLNAGMNNRDEMAFRASCKTLVDGAEPIVLHRMAQAAIDRGALEDMMMLYAILNENIKLPRDQRAFMNQSLLELLAPEEWTASQSLLTQIVDLHTEAGAAYARLAGHVGQASIMRISRGLAAVKLDKDGIPLAGDEERVMAGKAKPPRRFTARMSARSSAPDTGGSVGHAAGPGPVRRLPPGKRTPRPKGMPRSGT